MENFPKLSHKVHFRCFLAVLKVLFALAPKGAVFRGFVSRVGESVAFRLFYYNMDTCNSCDY